MRAAEFLDFSTFLMNEETDMPVYSTVFAVDINNVTSKLTWVSQAWFGVGCEVSKYTLL